MQIYIDIHDYTETKQYNHLKTSTIFYFLGNFFKYLSLGGWFGIFPGIYQVFWNSVEPEQNIKILGICSNYQR